MKNLSQAINNAPKSSIRKLFELVLKAKNAISFGIGQPDFTPPEFVLEEISKALKEKKTQYAPTLGLPRLREIVAEKFRKENSLNWVEPKNIIITNGGSHALQLAYAILSNPGDEIIVSSPNFLSYFYLASFYQLKVKDIPRKENFVPDFDEIEQNITEKTKFIIINSPNNPTGYVYSKSDMDKLIDIVLSNDLYLVSDEVYEKFIYGAFSHISPATKEEMAERTLTLNAMSKTFAATGLRVGYIAADEKFINLMEKYAQYSAAGVSHPTQYGAIAALERGNPELKKIIPSYNKKREYCTKRLKELGFDVYEPHGAFYIMPSVKPFNLDGDTFAQRLMEQREVAVVPGSGFGAKAQDFIRISYATSDEKLEEGFNRIEKFISSIGK